MLPVEVGDESCAPGLRPFGSRSAACPARPATFFAASAASCVGWLDEKADMLERMSAAGRDGSLWD